MIRFQEENEKIFLYQDGKLLSEIIEPFVLFDKETKNVLQIGNKKNVMNFYKTASNISKNRNLDVYENWEMKELPKNVEVLNNIIQQLKDFIH